MSELVLYVVATVVVLAGVAYFFVKQREQEALLSQRKPRPQAKKAKKETKEPKEPRENKIRKPRPAKAEEPEKTTSSRKKKNNEEDETKGVLDFLKGKKFSSEKAQQTIQAKVRSAPPTEVKTAPKQAKVQESDSESGSDSEEYEKVKRKPKVTKGNKPEEDGEEQPQQQQTSKKKKFFTKQEEEEHKAGIAAAKAAREAAKAEREARKKLTPAERRKLRAEEDGEFKEQRQRRPRKERTEGEEGEENSEGERKSKYPPREPDQAPVFASEYEPADMDNILNNLTSYYQSHPEAGKPKKASKKVQQEESNDASVDQ